MTLGLDQLSTWHDPGEHVANVVVESPFGSAVKLKYDAAIGAFVLGRPLSLGLVFPFELGFFPGTLAEDGDPLDAAVLADVATFPGVVLRSRPIGVLKASQKAKGSKTRIRNDRVVLVACEDRRRRNMQNASDLSQRAREEIESFFAAAVALEDKELVFHGWGDRAAALRTIAGSLTIRRNTPRWSDRARAR
jgi:inorganic pyrophosphatase